MAREIALTQGQTALVSEPDFAYLSQFSWQFDSGYAARSERGQDRKKRKVYMHREVAARQGQVIENCFVDHCDGNKLNNQRENLRASSPQENAWNRASLPNGSSHYIGVHLSKGRYRAQIRVDGKCYNLGSHGCDKAAGRAYDRAARLLKGKWARLNFPNETEETMNFTVMPSHTRLVAEVGEERANQLSAARQAMAVKVVVPEGSVLVPREDGTTVLILPDLTTEIFRGELQLL